MLYFSECAYNVWFAISEKYEAPRNFVIPICTTYTNKRLLVAKLGNGTGKVHVIEETVLG